MAKKIKAEKRQRKKRKRMELQGRSLFSLAQTIGNKKKRRTKSGDSA